MKLMKSELLNFRTSETDFRTASQSLKKRSLV